MFFPDENPKTVKSPARFVDGSLINGLTLQPISDIENDTFCEVVLSASQITNNNLLEVLDTEKIDEFLPDGTELLANISRNEFLEGQADKVFRPKNILVGVTGSFASIILKEPLQLKFRGTKQPTLLDCKCFIPALNETAQSLNHAYSLISTEYEKHRRSHSRNVFHKIFYLSNNEDYTKNFWVELDRLRTTKVIEFHKYLGDLIEHSDKQTKIPSFDAQTYNLLKPFLKSILQEFNQDVSDSHKAIDILMFVLKEKYKLKKEEILSLKPYIVSLLEAIKDQRETL